MTALWGKVSTLKYPLKSMDSWGAVTLFGVTSIPEEVVCRGGTTLEPIGPRGRLYPCMVEVLSRGVGVGKPNPRRVPCPVVGATGGKGSKPGQNHVYRDMCRAVASAPD